MILIVPECLCTETYDLEPYFKKYNITYNKLIEKGIPKETINKWLKEEYINLENDPYCIHLLDLLPDLKEKVILW